jgi:uncharacterized protein YyaL (SSP411 family)
MRRLVAAVASAAVLACGAATLEPATASHPAHTSSASLLVRAADALDARHVLSPVGGWAWRSAIQAPHLQTDRDVGAASVAFGLLSAYDVTHRPAYLAAAEHAGDFLLAAEDPAGSGRWPDFVDPGHTAKYAFTSFDDGSAGDADLLWRLWEDTGDQRYKTGALAGMHWLETQARGALGESCPTACRWYWTDPFDQFGHATYTGMGEGQAGIIWAFSVFAQRTGNPVFERYAEGGARYLASLVTPEGALPERPAQAGYDTGYLSGSAGDAFCFLRLYQRTHDQAYLTTARRLLRWVRARAVSEHGGLAWPIEVETPSGHGGNPERATGVEEGDAGIAWVELQAYALTHDATYLATARAAGRWLLAVAGHQDAGLYWPEDEGHRLVHTSLDNGAPGIGIVLHDLAVATGDSRFAAAARGARTWIAAVAQEDSDGPFWFEHRGVHGWALPADPSWHWGSAGIIGFLATMDGWALDVPGEQPGLLDPE